MKHNRLIRGALSAFSLIALSIHALPSPQPTPVLPDAAVWALALWALSSLYGAWLKTNDPLRPRRLWVLSFFFAGMMTLGTSFSAFGTSEWLTGHLPAAVLYFAGRVPLYFAGMRLLLHLLTKPAQEAKPLRTVFAAGGLLLCWLPYFICLFPGTVSNDSLSQMRIILGLSRWSNANPICQTGLVGVFMKLGQLLGSGNAGVALYCVLQAVLMAWLLGSLLHEMSTAQAPRWLVGLSFAFYAFCPIFPVFAFCVGKDTNFAMAVLFLALECWRVLHREAAGRPARMLCVCVASAACVVLRNPGVYVVILTLVFVLLSTLRSKRWQAPLAGLLCAAVVFGSLHLFIIPTLDIEPMPETEEYSIPLQQVARVAASSSFTPEQAAAVDGVIPVDELKAAYNPELSDPVKDLWRKDVTPEAKAAFWKTWPAIIRDHPLTCVSATFHNTYGYLYPGYVSIMKPTLIMGDQSSRTANTEGLFTFSVNPMSAKLKAFTEALNRNALYRVLVSPGLYGWLTLLAAVWLMRGGDRRGLLCMVPALFTLAGCMLSAVNGYFRYTMPLYVSAPLLLFLMQQHKTFKDK